MKFGGASVATPEHFSRVADIILHRKKQFPRIVIVVSAMGNTTDQLIALASRVNPALPHRELDMLVTVGERISISLLAMALSAKNQEAISFTGSQSGIITSTNHTEARIIDVRPFRLLSCLDDERVVIVAGFQGVSKEKEITTLGRGGSDTTAVALGIALEATKVEFYKDVLGVYAEDPRVDPTASLIPYLSFVEALEIVSKGAKILSKRCLLLAEQNNIPLYVRSFEQDISRGTMIFEKRRGRSHAPVYESEEY